MGNTTNHIPQKIKMLKSISGNNGTGLLSINEALEIVWKCIIYFMVMKMLDCFKIGVPNCMMLQNVAYLGK